jgi:SAM-dependent methyltransferase
MRNALTNVDYWRAAWSAGPIGGTVSPDRDAFLWSHLPPIPGATFYEVGCYPGRFLQHFAHRHGYRVGGCDLLPEVLTLRTDLEARGCSVTDLDCADVFTLGERAYDIVASFGFIEHFRDVVGAVRSHVQILRPGGTLVLGVPNLHTIASRVLSQEYLPVHNLDIMSPGALRAAIEAAGCEPLASQYFFERFAVSGKFDHSGPVPRAAWAVLKAGYYGFVRAAEWSRRDALHRLAAGYLLAVGRKPEA